MAAMSSPSARPAAPDRRGDFSRRIIADPPIGPLVFSLVGLLTDCFALEMMQGEASLAPLGFVLIACAAPVAAMVALWLAGGADAVSS